MVVSFDVSEWRYALFRSVRTRMTLLQAAGGPVFEPRFPPVGMEVVDVSRGT